MTGRIKSLIADARRWQKEHAAAGRRIEAAACAIRTKALREALEIVEEEDG